MFEELAAQTTRLLKQVHDFYLDQQEPNRSCLLALRSIVLALDDEVAETKKYGMPCFCYRGRAFCYLWKDKATGEPYLLLVDGKRLNFPQLEQGNRARMKILRVNPKKHIPVRIVNAVLSSALKLCRNGSL